VENQGKIKRKRREKKTRMTRWSRDRHDDAGVTGEVEAEAEGTVGRRKRREG
jgi:hypothetical protein